MMTQLLNALHRHWPGRAAPHARPGETHRPAHEWAEYVVIPATQDLRIPYPTPRS